MKTVRCATAMIKALEAVGTEIAFGYNGHGNWALLDAIEFESNIRGVAARGEDQAVHLADGYARANKGKIPVVCTSVGPGNMNIAPALFSVPLRTYVAATFLGILPGTFAYAYLGSGIDSVIEAAEECPGECIFIEVDA